MEAGGARTQAWVFGVAGAHSPSACLVGWAHGQSPPIALVSGGASTTPFTTGCHLVEIYVQEQVGKEVDHPCRLF